MLTSFGHGYHYTPWCQHLYGLLLHVLAVISPLWLWMFLLFRTHWRTGTNKLHSETCIYCSRICCFHASVIHFFLSPKIAHINSVVFCQHITPQSVIFLGQLRILGHDPLCSFSDGFWEKCSESNVLFFGRYSSGYLSLAVITIYLQNVTIYWRSVNDGWVVGVNGWLNLYPTNASNPLKSASYVHTWPGALRPFKCSVQFCRGLEL